MSTPEDTFRDDAARKEAVKFDYKFCGIAFGVMFVIFGVIIGLLVSQNSSLETSVPATEAPVPVVASSAGNTTTSNSTSESSSASEVDLSCEKIMRNFSDNALMITLSVASSISSIEIDYAANVFEQTYSAMLANELTQAQADYCDPYCRKIVDVTVTSNSLTVAEARQAGECDSTLTMTFTVEGTFYGCEDTVFPGLFGVEGRRALKKNLRRILQDDADEDSCRVCPDGSTSLGLVSPSISNLRDTMKQFVTALPAICELTDASVIEP